MTLRSPCLIAAFLGRSDRMRVQHTAWLQRVVEPHRGVSGEPMLLMTIETPVGHQHIGIDRIRLFLFREIRRKLRAQAHPQSAELLAALLEEMPRITLRSPRPVHSGLVSFEIAGVAAKEAAERLLAQEFVVRFIPEPYPYVRASTHLFNTEEELETLAEAINKF